MAGELLGPDASSRTITLGLGQTAHGRTATVYTDTAATSLATIYTYDGTSTSTPGAAISGSTLTIDASSQLPRFWFPSSGVDTLYVRVNGKSGITTITADVDGRIDLLAGMVQAAAVTDAGALTSAAITGGESPTEAEHNAVQADVAALRTKLNALLGALRTAGVIHS